MRPLEDGTTPGARALALAEHFLDIDQPERALETLAKVGGADLEAGRYWILRTWACLKLERFDAAREAARRGLAVEPDARVLLKLLADAETGLGNLAEAEVLLLRALQQSPDDPWLLGSYAMLLARARQFDKAQRLLDRAIDLDPENEDVRRQRLVLAYLRGDQSAAAREGQALLEQDPQAAFGHYMLGQLALEAGQGPTARRRFGAAARLDPGTAAYAEVARRERGAAFWLLAPLWPVRRFGPARIWLTALAGIWLLRAGGAGRVAAVLAVVYIAYCVYTWVVPRMVERWVERRSLR